MLDRILNVTGTFNYNLHKYLADYIDPFYLSPFMYPKTIINTTKDLEKHRIPPKKASWDVFAVNMVLFVWHQIRQMSIHISKNMVSAVPKRRKRQHLTVHTSTWQIIFDNMWRAKNT